MLCSFKMHKPWILEGFFSSEPIFKNIAWKCLVAANLENTANLDSLRSGIQTTLQHITALEILTCGIILLILQGKIICLETIR